MIIDFNSNNLLIKSENVHALDYVVVPPRKQVKVHIVPKTRAIIPGAVGQVCLHDNFSHMGLISDKTTVTMPMDSTVYCMIYNKCRRPIFIKRNKCIETFRVYANEHVTTNINRPNVKDNKHESVSNGMNNNEQSHTSANKQHAKTNDKHDKDTSKIRVNEDEHTKPLEFDVANDNLTNEQKI